MKVEVFKKDGTVFVQLSQGNKLYSLNMTPVEARDLGRALVDKAAIPEYATFAAVREPGRPRRDEKGVVNTFSRGSTGASIMGRESVEPVGIDLRSDERLDTLIDLASKSANWTERNARYLIDKIETLEKAETWPRKIGGERDWERFCREILGYEAGATLRRFGKG